MYTIHIGSKTISSYDLSKKDCLKGMTICEYDALRALIADLEKIDIREIEKEMKL